MSEAPQDDARFHEFLMLQAQSAGLFLGQIPDPRSGERQINLRAAKSVIDCLEMLVGKTRGNLSATEEKLLHTAIKNLQPLYQNKLDENR